MRNFRFHFTNEIKPNYDLLNTLRWNVFPGILENSMVSESAISVQLFSGSSLSLCFLDFILLTSSNLTILAQVKRPGVD